MTSRKKASTSRKGRSVYAAFDPEADQRSAVTFCPSLLSSNFAFIDRELRRCRAARAPWIHVDVMDGHFVPNITFGPPVLKKWTSAQPDLFYDTHLMIEQPMQYAEQFIEAGANMVTVHIETLQRPRRDLRTIRRMGALCGLTIKPKTPLKDIMPYLDEVDLVLVMTVEPGFGGQEIIPRTLNKVRELDLLRREKKLSFRLQVDGGINVQTVPMAVAAGADTIVAGSAIFRGENIRANLKALREAIAKNGLD